MLETISTVGMSHDDWLKNRLESIGGSDAGAIIGLSKWSSPFSVWAEKTGRTASGVSDNEAMRQGRDLEEYVAERWREATGKKCRRRNQIIRNTDFPFAHANVDRWVVGENAGLECKTTSELDTRVFSSGEFPERYYAQCVHYMAVTNAEKWYLAVLVFGRGFYTFTLNRDDAEINALIEAEREFWDEYVTKDNPPPVDGLNATTEAIKEAWDDDGGDAGELYGFSEKAEMLVDAKARAKELDEVIKALENELKVAIGSASTATAGNVSITYKAQSRKSFDYKRFIEEHPGDDYEPYYKVSTSRVLKIKEAK